LLNGEVAMLRTVEATIDENGQVRLKEEVSLNGPARALVTILDEPSSDSVALNEAAILSETSLAEGWSGPDADEAWKHLAELPDLDRAQP
jgi:hypothetical protein